MTKKYIVRLTDSERKLLTDLVSQGSSKAYQIRHANILLKSDVQGSYWDDNKCAEAFNCHANTVANVRKPFVEEGLEASLQRKEQKSPSRVRKLDGAQEALLIAQSCSQPPEGKSRWTLHMLADRMVELNIVDSISHQTVSNILKKTN